MKAVFPSYQDRTTIKAIYEGLPPKQKKILDDYTAHLSATAGKGKVADYRRYMLQIYDVMEKPFDKLKPQDIINFVGLLNLDETREIGTKNCIKVTLKRFIKHFYAKNLKMVNDDILKKLNQKYVLVNEKKINKGTLLKPEEIEKLLRTAESMKLKAQVITLYETGCRPHELRCAKWKDIDWDRKLLNVYASKTSKARPIPLNESILHLKRWRQEFMFPNITDEDYIFPSPYDRKRAIGRYEFTYWIRSLGKKAKINRPVYPYLIRHTRLTELHNKFKVQGLEHKKFSGHSPQSDMTAVYVALDNEDMIESVVSKVYHVEDLTPEEQNKVKELQKRLESQQKEIDELKRPDWIIKTLIELRNNPKMQEEFLKGNLKNTPNEYEEYFEFDMPKIDKKRNSN